MRNHNHQEEYSLPLPFTYIHQGLPEAFTWSNVNGTSYLTRPLNQHLPQYCGSCFVHAAMSSLADRIKIARMTNHADEDAQASGPDINLSIQFILNCGAGIAGSCEGGSASGVFELIKQMGYVPYETCMPYIACSSESTEGFCPHANTECTPMNICRTCNNPSKGGTCTEVRTRNHTVVHSD